MSAKTRRLLILTIFSVALVLALQTGCDELITEQVFITEAGHPTADFSLDTGYSSGVGCVPCTVKFVDESNGPHQVLTWSFGDGDTAYDTIPADSSIAYDPPLHIYTAPGIYDVSLTVKDTALDGVDRRVKPRFVYVGLTSAEFSAEPNSGCPGTEVQFRPLEYSNVKSYSWLFGDNSSSIEASPLHTYGDVGTYICTLVATDDCGEDTATMQINIRQCPTVAIAADSTSGCVADGASLEIPFHDASDGNGSNVVVWAWQFPGGNPFNSVASDPVVTYTQGGRHDVILTVTNEDQGVATDTFVDYITAYTTPVVSMLPSVTEICYSPYRQFLVTFTDQSMGLGEQWIWDFGDGTYDSTEQNPTHAYTQPGFYTVGLKVINPCGFDSLAYDSLIIVSDQLLVSNVLIQIDTVDGIGDVFSTFRFSDVSTTGVITSRNWLINGTLVAQDVLQFDTVFDVEGEKIVTLQQSNSCGLVELEDTLIVPSL
ncbi:MAG: PKD domain-containing protein [Candidatus Zixiibacteriota bacterium]|nr:MAG: PKD domain-containing protein [candidate division Zixibacteria bacterium]